jgi:outer membrane protein TolC
MQIVEVSMASYRTAQNSFLDIIDAQRSLLDLQITLASEEARHDIAESNLLRMMGSKAVEGMHGLSSDNTLSEDK